MPAISCSRGVWFELPLLIYLQKEITEYNIMAQVYRQLNELFAAGQQAFASHCERVVSDIYY